ncbi:MAG: branched-chain amino acid ABC transporter permease [Firmicutes bacterium]|nr:branched-chain amino acid ABC transporter permease [Bacillota bacterium]
MKIGKIHLHKHCLLTIGSTLLLLVAIILVSEFRLLDAYKVRVLNLCAIYVILGLSMNLTLGYGGLLALGTAGFMCVGAYISALLTMSPEQKVANFFLEPIVPWLANVEVAFVIAIIAAGIGAAIFGFVIGAPALKLRGDYLAIATLGFAEIIRVVFTNTQSLTNGALGLKGIPSHTNLYWSWGLAILAVILARTMVTSSYGRAFKAIRDDQTAAEAMGINLFKHKVTIFVISAFMAGIGGALMGNLIVTVNPTFFRFMLTFQVLLIAVIGGLGSISGTVIAGIIVTIATEWLRIFESPMDLGFMRIPGIPGMRMVIFAVLLMAVIIFWRQGLMGRTEVSWERTFAFLNRVRTRFQSGRGVGQ